ncbi:NADH/ubiquinone/plastoquinone (complex I), partial [candidate division WOR-3 bacterium]|nr:NADH/ubiquinone/plastoquinone (complex I) [candidate division WOR-3 bacterium]
VNYMERFTEKNRYYCLFLLMLAGMNGVILSGDMFNLFVFLEIAAISSYSLVAFGTESEELEAAFKYQVMGTIASSFILLGIALLYSYTGTLNMADMARVIAIKNSESGILNSVSSISHFQLVNFVCGLFIMGFGMKAAIVPFHAWLPDAHPSAPAPISAMLSGVLIKALGVYVLIRIVFNITGMTPVFSNILLVLGTLSIMGGVVSAIGQWDFKRLLAYHSISQVGYIILGIGLGTPLGILGGLFHLLNHSVFKSLLFLNSGAVVYATGTRDLKQMGGLNKRMPVTGNSSFIASMSIAGVPPFNGFWSKLIIIIACIQANRIGFAIWAIIGSILTLASFMKVQRYAFFGPLNEKWKGIKEVPGFMRVSMVLLAILCIGMGLLLLPQVREVLLNPAVEVLENGIEYAKTILL